MKTISQQIKGLNGRIKIPGDKSISHRALMLASLANGTTEIKGLLESQDVLCTAKALQQLGIKIERTAPFSWKVTGGAFSPSLTPLDMGNAGTGARLLMGLVSTFDFKTQFTGDESLCSRPMKRVINPLSKSGALFETTPNQTLPLTVVGAKTPCPYTHCLDVASAQVKSAILLSGLNIEGKTSVIEPAPLKSRDHTERMLKGFGADIKITKQEDNSNLITLTGKAKLHACSIDVPSDISSAAFFIVAALITPDSDILLENIGVNPLRAGIIPLLQEMGGNIVYEKEYEVAGERVADIRVKASSLKGIDVPANVAASLIDEYPILAIAASFATGETILRGLNELKVKESNRYDAIIEGLRKNGVQCEPQSDEKTQQAELRIMGNGKNACGGGLIEAKLDHRIAMSFIVMGMASEKPVCVDDISSIQTSFPDFIEQMNNAGANINDYRN